MINTDSKYAFGVVHTFVKIWMERELINSKGRDLVPKELITGTGQSDDARRTCYCPHKRGGPWKPGETGLQMRP